MFASRRCRTNFLTGLVVGVVSTALVAGFASCEEDAEIAEDYCLESNQDTYFVDKLEQGFQDSLYNLILSCKQETSSFFDRNCSVVIRYGGKDNIYRFQPYKLSTDRDYIINPANLEKTLDENLGEYTDLDER